MAEDTKEITDPKLLAALTPKPYAPHGWQNDIELDVTGGTDPTDITAANWATIQKFTRSFTWAGGDVLDANGYLADKDSTNTDVTGHAATAAITGTMMLGDICAEYIMSMLLSTGVKRRTRARVTMASGMQIVSEVVIENIVPLGGNGNAKSTFTFTIALVGNPIVTQLGRTVTGVDYGGNHLIDQTASSDKVNGSGQQQ